ncbi:hypothetical protein SAMN02983003_3842 [Devosia enhydra]|uniref:Uncharacterized protein n=1 Tax=Devosia enhydra TaxID=665118 RepID=A0A1K2I353_9HYPH|nr:DUF459 domain-containing protein [Devosia enhydra]SFZ86651.1 hypothetical protein SAMN02983003_3842 [Devosia enhydra]
MTARKLIAGLLVLLALAGMVMADLGPAMAQPALAQPGYGDRIEVAQLFGRQQQQQPQQAQPPRRRTLMDMLFGGREQQQQQQVQQQQQQQRQQQQQAPRRASAPAALPPPKPTVEKAEGATRLAVFGDSMAVDLAKALERLFAEDPNLVVLDQGVGSSGLVRADYFDWPGAIRDAIAKDSFDLAIFTIGINDRQNLTVDGEAARPLTPEWAKAYQERAQAVLDLFRAARKPVIWVGLPPMEQPSYAQAMSEISSIHRLAAVASGAEFVDIYERFVSEDNRYTAFGPDLNGNRVRMRKDDGIHLSAAGADKVAFYLDQAIKLFYRGGGGVSIEVADVLAGTEAQAMLRPPFQGLGQIRLLEVAGAVISLTAAPRRASELLTLAAAPEPGAGFDLDMLVLAPVGRADAFGVGREPVAETAEAAN